jgi:hypothetical protein
MISNRMQKLRARRTDTTMKAAAAFDEAYDRIQDDDTIKYVVGTMQPIDKEYTQKTFSEGDRIKNQLNGELNSWTEQAQFRYQGSVSNDTHIKVHSDLDLLVIDTDFESIEPPAKPQFPYTGDSLAELKKLRVRCASILRNAFPAVKVDDSPGKCIALSGGSLRREIDVVIANWWNTVDYQQYGNEIFRGVKILDSSDNVRHENKPFLHNFRIGNTDEDVAGNLRKVIRFLKSLKYDADDKLEISSYDISAIAWNMPKGYLNAKRGQELILVENTKTYLQLLIDNDVQRNSLEVPNGTRKVFGQNGATNDQLLYLQFEVRETALDIQSALIKTYRQMKDAVVAY